MKIKTTVGRIFKTACICFTLAVYVLNAFKAAISPDSSLNLSFGLLSGFLVFGALLGLTNSLLDRSKLEGIVKRVIHFFATCANLFFSIGFLGGYLIEDPMSNSPISLPNKILYFFIAYVVIYFVFVGVGAIVKMISNKSKEANLEYESVLSKRK